MRLTSRERESHSLCEDRRSACSEVVRSLCLLAWRGEGGEGEGGRGGERRGEEGRGGIQGEVLKPLILTLHAGHSVVYTHIRAHIGVITHQKER